MPYAKDAGGAMLLVPKHCPLPADTKERQGAGKHNKPPTEVKF